MSKNAMLNCIDACTACHCVCLHTFQHCLHKGGHHAEPEHIRMLVDCAQMCAVSADFMIRGSTMHSETCRACAAICEHCAEDCLQHNDDDFMPRCIDACRKCAALCNEMAAHTAIV